MKVKRNVEMMIRNEDEKRKWKKMRKKIIHVGRKRKGKEISMRE